METAVKDRSETYEQRCHDGLVIVLERLYALKEDEDDNELPTATAYTKICDLLIRANSLMQLDFPRGTPSVEEDRGIRIEWRRGPREVKLVVAPQSGGLEYVYQAENASHSLDKNVTPAVLAHWLDWLAAA